MSVQYKDYYKILGVSKNDSERDIKRSYRKLAKKYHPDVNKSGDGDQKYRDINEAYEVLKDPEKRRLYDELGPNWQNGQNFQGGGAYGPQGQRVNMDFGDDMGGFSDFFRTVFGGGGMGGMNMGGMGSDDMFFGQRGPSRGPDQDVTLTLNVSEVIKAPLKKKITLREQTGERTLEVNLPRGISNGSKLKLRGQGAPGMGGGPRGDLNVTIKLETAPAYEIDRHDITTVVKVSPWEAALGMEALPVNTLDGSIKIKLPSGTQGGQRLRVKGKGLPLRGSGNGDLYVRIEIAIPKSLSDEERKLFEKLRENSSFVPR